MNWTFPLYEPGRPLPWEALLAAHDWLRDMRGVPQDAEWHAEGDVLTHTMMVAEALVALPEFKALQAQDQHILVAAALLHDVEKRSTTATELLDGRERIVAPGHARKGESTVRRWLYETAGAPFAVREDIAKLVRLHGLPLWAIYKEQPARAAIEASLSVNTAMLAMLAKADVLGRRCPDADDLLLRIALFEELCREQGCWGRPKAFASDYGRHAFLTKDGYSPDHAPYDPCQFEVYMMAGLPGAGKDTYIRRHFDLPVLSLDELRRAHKVDPSDKKGNGQMVQLGMEQARVWLRAKQPFVYNATNLTADMRGKWGGLFLEYGARLRIVYVEVPYAQLLRQNRQREHVVPEAVLGRLLGKLEPPGYREAHSLEWQVREG